MVAKLFGSKLSRAKGVSVNDKAGGTAATAPASSSTLSSSTTTTTSRGRSYSSTSFGSNSSKSLTVKQKVVAAAAAKEHHHHHHKNTVKDISNKPHIKLWTHAPVTELVSHLPTISDSAKEGMDLGKLLGSGACSEVWEIKRLAGFVVGDENGKSATVTITLKQHQQQEQRDCRDDVMDDCHNHREEEPSVTSQLSESLSFSSSSSTSSCFSSVEATTTPQFALKRIHERALKDKKKKKLAIRDLSFEADILSRIVLPYQQQNDNNKNNNEGHHHIIRIHAVSHDFFENPAERFLVLDYLTETLSQRFDYWKRLFNIHTSSNNTNNNLQGSDNNHICKSSYCTHHHNQYSNSACLLLEKVTNKLFRNKKMSQNHAQFVQQERQRLSEVGLGIARGMAFLHRHGIIYRDLKPANIGFDCHGTVRIFDLGLARCIGSDDTTTPSSEQVLGSFGEAPLTKQVPHLKGVAGTYRYMAPEVFSNKEYSFPADVYSFSMVLYELVTLLAPLPCVRYPSQVQTIVIDAQIRPPLIRIHCGKQQMKQLFQSSWHPSPDERPTFEQIVHTLEEVVESPTLTTK